MSNWFLVYPAVISRHRSPFLLLAVLFVPNLWASSPRWSCVSLALCNNLHLLSPVFAVPPTGRHEWLGVFVSLDMYAGYLRGNVFPSTTYCRGCTVLVSSRKYTARHLLLGAPGTPLWFRKWRPLICGFCGRGRWCCGLQTADGSLFPSKRKNSVGMWWCRTSCDQFGACSMMWFALQAAVHQCHGVILRKGDSVGCVFRPEASFRGSREWSKTSNKAPWAENFLLHLSRAYSSCSPQAKVPLPSYTDLSVEEIFVHGHLPHQGSCGTAYCKFRVQRSMTAIICNDPGGYVQQFG